MAAGPEDPAGAAARRRLYVYNGGFLTQTRIRRILELSGYDIRLGAPSDPTDMVGVWGQSPTSHRGEAVAARRDAPILRVEDAFLRSILPGRDKEPPLGLNIDASGVHFDPATPSDLETLLADAPLDDTSILNRARDAIERLKASHLSKFNAFDPALPVPDPGYVLVVDQTNGDASVRASGADAATFREMLVFAQEENPGAQILIKTHPETRAGHRPGYFDQNDLSDRVAFCDDPVSPWTLLEGATGVYTVSSQLGFEAILAGHKPRIFGQPFYAGWDLTQDENPVPRRTRSLTRAQLAAAALVLYPTWYDPHHDRLCELEDVLAILEARAKAWREDRHGWVGCRIRLWKRKSMQRVFGRQRRMVFEDDPTRAASRAVSDERRLMVWASKDGEVPEGATRVEDGFLRSRGLGAELIPPLSLVLDDHGIYYDPTRPSRMEQLIAQRATLREDQRRRAEALIRAIVAAKVTKYNLSGSVEGLPPIGSPQKVILVPGQVEDDASIRLGAGEICTNLGLLQAVRAAEPEAFIVYKPHPDVEAGLRPGEIPSDDLADLADMVAATTDPVALMARADAVWTMTSLLGFEAMLRRVPVTTTGAPFYAGWGLTEDRGNVPARRGTEVSLEGLVHAALIDYPRYFDPITGHPCPAEVVVERLASGRIPHPGPGNRALAKLQGIFATYAHLWR